MQTIIWALDAAGTEIMLFATIGLLLGGIDDLALDVAWLTRRWWAPPQPLHKTTPPLSRRFAIFVAAWDEAAVIAAMLQTTLARLDHPHYRIYVGTYPNDPATSHAVASVDDPRVRLVLGPRAGPTTKADNLNAMWRALARDDAAAGVRTEAIVLHDAEDVVHADELSVFERHLRDHGAVQLPVMPLIDRRARLVSGHYADEFAEAHTRQLVVRAALGAGLPLSGVGCAITVEALDALEAMHGTPFDPASLTEDYELGLRLGEIGRTACFARVRDAAGAPVAVRAFFPATIPTAVRQKARWMTGIALSGWDRVGWSPHLGAAELWMRMRDRRATLAIFVLAAAYAALVLWAISAAAHALLDTAAAPPTRMVRALLSVNAVLLAWRLLWRMILTARGYGWREGLWAAPRMVVGNYVALLAGRRAIAQYWRLLRGGQPFWDKTAHVFPPHLPETNPH